MPSLCWLHPGCDGASIVAQMRGEGHVAQREFLDNLMLKQGGFCLELEEELDDTITCGEEYLQEVRTKLDAERDATVKAETNDAAKAPGDVLANSVTHCYSSKQNETS